MKYSLNRNPGSPLKRYSPAIRTLIMVASIILCSHALNDAVSQTRIIEPVTQGKSGHLVYKPDSLGNRIPDFSYCGYMAGERAIPDVPVRIVVPATEDDATFRIQCAIDYVASLSPDAGGIRGAVLLEKGVFKVDGSLNIHTSGIVLRGSGTDENGTVILGTGKDRNTLISIAGKDDRKKGPVYQITGSYTPVNAMEVKTEFSGSFRIGDKIMIIRPSTVNWIKDIHMEEFGGAIGWHRWKPGTRDLSWDRTIMAINGNRINLDAPITTALDEKYGGGFIAGYEWPGRISNNGVENLCCISDFDENNPKDEDHRWMAITMENVQDAWVRQLVFKHFAGSAVALFETTKRITIEDCKSEAPVSEIGGMRRNTFFTLGQQTLFQRCHAAYGYHDFTTGFCAAGPNAFVQCASHLPFSFSGSIDSWASGVLFDIVNIDGNALSFVNLQQAKQGAGWNAASSVFWQCSASRVDCYSPPTATNWAFGTWAEFSGDGAWYESNNHIRPRSLYYRQLADRLGDSIMKTAYLLPITYEACTSPSVEKAETYAEKAVKPCIKLSDWISLAGERQPIPTAHHGIISVDQIEMKKPSHTEISKSIEFMNGRLLCDGKILTGGRIRNSYWRGDIRPQGIHASSPHLTRYVPGRSGKETAWDGLSKYDLMKYNHWYWKRLNQFAALADQKGLILIHQNYFQHNVLEAGAHWSDFPWRTANNINHTGFPEPVFYAGDKRIFMAEQFYDVNHPVRREIHKAYIRKCLDDFKDNHNIIQLISAEYTGPLSFTRFWIDVIREWQEETNKNVIIGLSATKDVQDSILMDPVRSPFISLIDIRYWQYREDGTLYAPQGGRNLAPRQHARLTAPGETSFRQVYRAVLEYRKEYPQKAVMYSFGKYAEYGWAVFMAGGSLANIPVVADSAFLRDAAHMSPIELSENSEHQYAIGNEQSGYILYNDSRKPMVIEQAKISGNKGIYFIDPETGHFIDYRMEITEGKSITIPNPNKRPVVIWIRKSSFNTKL